MRSNSPPPYSPGNNNLPVSDESKFDEFLFYGKCVSEYKTAKKLVVSSFEEHNFFGALELLLSIGGFFQDKKLYNLMYALANVGSYYIKNPSRREEADDILKKIKEMSGSLGSEEDKKIITAAANDITNIMLKSILGDKNHNS
ncbi:hypothetical protein J4209_02180 [Candidatus Woesearchaeota archaeon]|nr:hypothetical protein [Candidatus Woesearchaeota archaeon]